VGAEATVTPFDFQFVRVLVREQSGLALADGKEYLVAARLAPIVRREGLGSVAELIGQVRRGTTGLRDEVVEAMATNETSFFRDVRPFDFLRDEIIPALVRERPTSGLRIWSAAASTGQEAFSLAMLLREHFPGVSPVSILATDLGRDVLAVAEAASFSQLEVNRGLPAALLVRYFRRQGLRWELTEPVRAMVAFRQVNLTRPLPALPAMDVVFLRNVLIYFDEATKVEVLTRVAGAMRPGGYLILGSAETLRNLDDRYERVKTDRTVCYRLRERAEP
jgi:chemotaxis protein methyltransferase CheR